MQLKSATDKKLRLAVLHADDYLNSSTCSSNAGPCAAIMVDSTEESYAVPSCPPLTVVTEQSIHLSKPDEP